MPVANVAPRLLLVASLFASAFGCGRTLNDAAPAAGSAGAGGAGKGGAGGKGGKAGAGGGPAAGASGAWVPWTLVNQLCPDAEVSTDPGALTPVGAGVKGCDLPGLTECQRLDAPGQQSKIGFSTFAFATADWGSFSGSFGTGIFDTPSNHQETRIESDGVVRGAIRTLGNPACGILNVAESNGLRYARGIVYKNPEASFIVTWAVGVSPLDGSILKLNGNLGVPANPMNVANGLLTSAISGGLFGVVDLNTLLVTKPTPTTGQYQSLSPQSYLDDGVLFNRWMEQGGGVWWWSPNTGSQLVLDGPSDPYVYWSATAAGDWIVGGRVPKVGGAYEVWRMPRAGWKTAKPGTPTVVATYPGLNASETAIGLLGNWIWLRSGIGSQNHVIHVLTGERRRIPLCKSCDLVPVIERGEYFFTDGVVPSPVAATPAIYRLKISELPPWP